MLAAIAGSAGSQVTSRPAFEAASVKPTRNSGYPKPGAPRIQMINGGRFVAETISLPFLIRLAYKVMEVQIVGEPAWAKSARFEIDAKARTNASLAEMRPMIQSLLADRFKLVLHRETREIPVYELVAAKGGLKLSRREGSCVPLDPSETRPRTCGDVGGGKDFLEGFGVSMPAFVEALSDTVDRKVIDKTGYAGTFDFHLTFARDEAASDAAGPSVFTALQEELGLRLKPAKDPVEVLVIDHAERPGEN
jgi:uncharacterized protein (TIGR03435 family)